MHEKIENTLPKLENIKTEVYNIKAELKCLKEDDSWLQICNLYQNRNEGVESYYQNNLWMSFLNVCCRKTLANILY